MRTTIKLECDCGGKTEMTLDHTYASDGRSFIKDIYELFHDQHSTCIMNNKHKVKIRTNLPKSDGK